MTTNVEVDETNIKAIIKAFEDIYNNIDKYVDKTDKKIIEEGKKYLDERYAKRFKDPNITDISTKYKKIDDGYQLISEGKDVIYEEFGTGDRGADDGHPWKGAYNLNPYNSGSTIRNVSDVMEGSLAKEDLDSMGITSGKYWTYKKGDTVYYTQGVPSGKEMWDTRNHMIKEIIPKSIKELEVELREKFEKSVKK